MAIWKKLRCANGHEQRVGKGKISRKPPPCPKCGEAREYSENWYVSLQVEGKPYVKSVSTRWEDADNHQTEVKSRRMKGELVVDFQKHTFGDAVDRFLDWVGSNKRLADSTKRAYRCTIARAVPFMERYRLSDIDHCVLEQLMEYLEEAELSPSSINGTLTSLSNTFNLAVKHKMMRVNPMAGLEWAVPTKASDRFLSLEECEKLLQAAGSVARGGRMQMMILLSLRTGLRHNGCATLRWDEIDFSRGVITKVVKGGKAVTVPITAKLKSELQTYWQQRKVVSPYLFPKAEDAGGCIKKDNKAFREAAKKAGLGPDVKFHTLRHTFATHFIMATKDLHMLAGILGHSNTYITQRYAHYCQDRMADAMRIYEEQSWQKAR